MSPQYGELRPTSGWHLLANFNRFRVLAALLHGSQVVGVSDTLRRWTEGVTYVRHHVGTEQITFHILFNIIPPCPLRCTVCIIPSTFIAVRHLIQQASYVRHVKSISSFLVIPYPTIRRDLHCCSFHSEQTHKVPHIHLLTKCIAFISHISLLCIRQLLTYN